MAWLTGYDGWSFYVHQCVIIGPEWRSSVVWPRTGCQRRAVAPLDELSRTIIGYPDSLRSIDERHPMDYPRREARPNAGGAHSSIGVEMDNYWFSAKGFAVAQRRAAQCPFLDVTNARQLAACVKSEAGT
jgi:ectoine hydrolase